MDWSALQQFFVGFYEDWQNLAQVILILAGTLIISLILHFLLRNFHQRLNSSTHVWRDAILGALSAPLQGVIWIIGLTIAEGALTARGQMPLLNEVFPPARDVVVIAIVAWFLVRVIRGAENNLFAQAQKHGKEIDETAADAIGKLTRAVIVVVALLVMMQSLGFSIASLIAFGGVGGIAVGFAAQSLVANLLGGFTVYASRPFKVGEYIIFPGTDLMGQVEHIGWRATRVMGFNKKPFYVPNAKFNTETIINHSRMANRCLEEYVYLRLQDIDHVPAVVDEVHKMLSQHTEIDQEFFAFNFDSYGEHALKFFLYAYTVATGYTDYMRIKADVLLKIAAIVRDHNAELAVPVSTVYMPEGVALQRDYGRDASQSAPDGSRPAQA